MTLSLVRVDDRLIHGQVIAVWLRALGAEAVLSAPADQEFVELAARASVALTPAFMPVKDWIESRAPSAG